jgi:formylglycine-generating enzyme required for sulfatase activity/tRNA A-37 threonylcarbamoyl transferase component Bud32
MTIATGTRLGRYEVRSRLGAGGMGEVYVAFDHDLQREVAIKVLRDGTGDSSDRVRRFMQEARVASALHHPNVAHVYEFGTQDSLRFIAMEIIDGETLRDRLSRGPLSIHDALDLGSQIAAALAAAHKQNIVHRDVKPENVMITSDGYAKVLDFGLAKLREARAQDDETILKTASGVALGTLRYMAPEQLSGGEVTPASDVFSLGVVLYEMVCGRRPFDGPTATDTATAILTRTPQPLCRQRDDTPPKLESVISRALAKAVDDRYPSAGEMLEELKQLSRESTVTSPVLRARRTMPRWLMFAAPALVVVAIAVGATWVGARNKRIRTAEQSIETAKKLLAQRRMADAYDAAVAAAAVLPHDERVRELISSTSERLSIDSDPKGAVVYLERFKGPSGRTRAGTTPLKIPRLARADYIATFEKPGYATLTRTIPMAPFYVRGGAARPASPEELRVKLSEAGTVPREMVRVEGGEHRLSGWSRPTDRVVALRDFLIDRYEVSNRDFDEFVRAGGYRKRELWKHPFVDGAKTLRFEEAMARFRDKTGLPGPRNWEGGAPPAGRENHPVTDVSWYEASAFAEWKGKALPTIYQWEKAARYPSAPIASSMNLPWGLVGVGVDVTERANFSGKGTMPVDSAPFGVSFWGARHMAGNVSEWCRNPKKPGFAFRGGSWNDPVYAFGMTGGYPPFFSNGTLGFRCVKEPSGGADDQGAFALGETNFVPEYRAVGDREFAEIRKRYEYAKTPLRARIVQTVDAPGWTRETIAYDVAGTTVTAYLYLPKGFRRPLEVIHFAPAGDVDDGFRTLPASMETQLPPFIRGGRAAFAVVLEGYVGRPRPPGSEQPDTRSADYVDFVVKRTTELRRGLDYIETRKDLDSSRIAFMGPSAGSFTGLVVTALEDRYRSILFIGTGIRPRWVSDADAANRINFIPRIRGPKLMLHGRYDENVALESEAMPLFRMLPEPKRLELFEGGHGPEPDIAIRKVTEWLDETLGPVAQ